MAQITYADKVAQAPPPTGRVRASDMNEIKSVVNANATPVKGKYNFNGSYVQAIATVDTPVKIGVATSTNGYELGSFTHSNNRLTYTGEISVDVFVTLTLSLTSSSGKQFRAYIAKNGEIVSDSRALFRSINANDERESVGQTLLTLSENDYIEVFIENNTDNTDPTIVALTLLTFRIT